MGTSPPIFQAWSAWLAAALKGKPFLLEIRDLWPEFAVGLGVLQNPWLVYLARSLERFLYRRARHIVVNSPAYRDYLLDKGVRDAKITLVPNGVDVKMFLRPGRDRCTRRPWGMKDNQRRFTVIYTGALGLANDIPTIIRAARRLTTQPEILFVLVGDGKERPRLEAQARQMGLENLVFAGSKPKSEIPGFLAASDACIATLQDIPLFRTTYPNKVFDYMAAGRPTVLAIDGVIREVLEKAGGGICVPPGDDQKLAEAILYLKNNPRQARQMGQAARAHAIRYFDRTQQAQKLLHLIASLNDGSPSDA
jgi:glycosyltransferase involved in cell wall biosynthesis